MKIVIGQQLVQKKAINSLLQEEVKQIQVLMDKSKFKKIQINKNQEISGKIKLVNLVKMN